MGWRFFRRTKIAPGLTLNLSRAGPSLSMGPRGARMTVGRRGVRRTVGIPGSGVHYTTQSGWGSSKRTGSATRTRRSRAAVAQAAAKERLSLGFLDRISIPRSERDFTEALRSELAGDDAAALKHAEQSASEHPDSAFLAGAIQFKRGRYAQAEKHFMTARRSPARLGALYRKYEVRFAVSMPIAQGVWAHLQPTPAGALLALAETHQSQGRWRESAKDLERLHKEQPHDLVVRLSLMELLVEHFGEPRGLKMAAEMGAGVENESAIHAGVLYFAGKALRLLDIQTGARDQLTKSLRRSKDRPPELLTAARYERALVYEALGQRSRSRSELERVYAEDPRFEDVAGRLGV
ncbi:MAG: DUF4236 domain-containing protein [Phycisphaeraceae bacterium]|nr:MAG: DUF4236 domain-containing protein [Phycisphaeraceae bacterium]